VEVHGFDGTCRVEHDDELIAQLRSVRRGTDGAFILDHGGGGSLWVHINGDAAFLWFCPDSNSHPGFVPNGMWPGDRCDVRFVLLVGGSQGDSILAPWWQLLPIEAAYRAAVEYLHAPASLPASVTWFELARAK